MVRLKRMCSCGCPVDPWPSKCRPNPLEGWGFVAFGDVFVVEFAFGFDAAGEVFDAGGFAPRHHQGALVDIDDRVVFGQADLAAGQAQCRKQLRAAGFGGVGVRSVRSRCGAVG